MIRFNFQNYPIEKLHEMMDILTTPDKRYEYFDNLKDDMIQELEREIQRQTIYYTVPVNEHQKRFLVEIPANRKYFPRPWNEVIYYPVKNNMMSWQSVRTNEQIRPDATHIYESGK